MSERGFTLLEILIAIGIMALVVTVAVQAHLGIEDAQAHARSGLQRERVAQILLGRMERELLGTVLLVKPAEVDRLSHPWVFVGADGANEGRDADALRFVTRTPLRAGVSRPAVGVAMVSYVTRDSDEIGLTLLREEQPLPEGMDTSIRVTEPDVVADRLARFDLRYLDEAGGWVDRWNSADVVTADTLPRAVEIAVQLWEEGPDGAPVEGPEHRREIALPVRPFDLAALRAAAAGAAEEAECLTQAACVNRLREEIATADEETRAEIEAEIEERGEECFEPDSPLGSLLSGLGVDVEERCSE